MRKHIYKSLYGMFQCVRVHCLHWTVHFCNALSTALTQLLCLACTGNCELLSVPNKHRKPQCQNISVLVFKLTTIDHDQSLFVSITILTTLFGIKLDAFLSSEVLSQQNIYGGILYYTKKENNFCPFLAIPVRE